MRSLIPLATLCTLLMAGGCSITTTSGMSTPEGQAIAAVDPGPWYSDTASKAYGPVGPGDFRQVHWWQGDPAWQAFLLLGVPGPAAATAGQAGN
jgi:hypothetical protein